MSNKYFKRVEKWINLLDSHPESQLYGEETRGDTFKPTHGCACSMALGLIPKKQLQNLIDDDFFVEPEDLASYMGLSCESINKVINMNDLKKKDFKQIARYIEKNLLPIAGQNE